MDYKILSDDIVDQLHENYKSAPESASVPYNNGQHRKEIETAIRRAQMKRVDPPEVENIFGDQDRIYLDFVLHPEMREKSQTEKRIEEYLAGNRPLYTDLNGQVTYKTDAERELFIRYGMVYLIGKYETDPARLDLPKYKITDYINGYATDDAGKQQYKIGKLLKNEPELLKNFNSDNARMVYHGNLMIVISRKAEDIASMSMGRNWSSCMSPDGKNVRYLPKDIENGSLIAYLVRKSDRDIEKPLSRILIKPFFKLSDKDRTFGEVKSRIFQFNSKAARIANVILPSIKPQDVFFQPGHAYGLGSYEFAQAVTHFVTKELNADKQGVYHIAPEVYRDHMARSISRDGKSTGFQM